MYPFFVVGTRPEIVKMAPLIQECKSRNTDYFLLHTGQHYSETMSAVFFEDMGINLPDKNLNIGSGTQAEQTAKALVGIEKELVEEEPDVVLVLGDTNAVLSAALAAAKMRIPVGHIEAGLRSYDMRMPEEHNRRLTDHLSDYLFAPTETSAKILERENVWGKVYITGNTVIDAIENRLSEARKRKIPIEEVEEGQFALLTLHRAENVDERNILSGIIDGLLSLEIDMIFPAHPRTVSRLEAFGLMDKIKSGNRIRIIEPVSYLKFLKLMDMCSYILTDSGGIQEEATAPSLNKRVFVLRTSTERPEAIESGHVVLVGVDPDKITKLVKENLESIVSGQSPYGDGTASKKILDILEREVS